jgi:membrane protein insertase Oxa1/YidC/SpoIIIJ
MVLVSPLMILFFALNVPAGLGLYWFVGNCVSIIQQSFVVGWGNVLPKRWQPVAANAAPALTSKSPAGKSPTGKSSANGQRSGTQPLPSNTNKQTRKQKNRAQGLGRGE